MFKTRIAAFAGAAMLGAVAPDTSLAQADYYGPPRVRPRVQIYPAPRPVYRECQAKLVPEWRPSGTVIVPRMQCWWVRG